MSDYNNLINKPKINNVEVSGDKTFQDYHICPIMFDSQTRYLYTILQDNTRVNIKYVSPLPAGYTQLNAIILFDDRADGFSLPVSGDIIWNAELAWYNNGPGQYLGYENAANAYIGITANGEISAEWSMSDRGVPNSVPTNRNKIHANFTSNTMTELTIDGFNTPSYGYPYYFQDYNIFSSFGLNCANFAGRVTVIYWWFNIIKNNQVLYDMYPCKRNSDNAIGFYDIANNNFYPINGATEYIAS